MTNVSQAARVRGGYPTAEAYEKACEALEKHRKRADVAEAQVLSVRAIHAPTSSEVEVNGIAEPDYCAGCGEYYPCETIVTLDGNR